MCGHSCLTKHIPSLRQIVDTAINKNQTEYKTLEIQPPYRGLLSSSCRGLQLLVSPQGPFGSKGDFSRQMDGRTDGRTTGLKAVRLV